MIDYYVFDTNVIISAILIETSVSALALAKAQAMGLILQSDETFAELKTTICRKKFSKYLSAEKRDKFLEIFEKQSKFIVVTTNPTICRDPKDNKFLGLAVDGQATCIVSGDNDLRILQKFEAIVILSPSEFLAQSE
jgi:uncharacterized protein